MAQCLMLDVDGVLVTGRPQDGLRWDHGLQDDLGISQELLGQAFFARSWDRIVLGELGLLPALAEVLRDIAPSVPAEDLVDYWFRMDSRIAEDVLADCRAARRAGLAIYLTTNQEHLRAAYLMDRMGLAEEVDGIVYSAQFGARKPQPRFFAQAARAVGAAPEDLLLVDDSPTNVAAARRAGWRAAHWDGSRPLSAILQHEAFP